MLSDYAIIIMHVLLPNARKVCLIGPTELINCPKLVGAQAKVYACLGA